MVPEFSSQFLDFTSKRSVGWYAYTEKDIIDIVKKYRKCGVPLDVMVIDTDWRVGASRAFVAGALRTVRPSTAFRGRRLR